MHHHVSYLARMIQFLIADEQLPSFTTEPNFNSFVKSPSYPIVCSILVFGKPNPRFHPEFKADPVDFTEGALQAVEVD